MHIGVCVRVCASVFAGWQMPLVTIKLTMRFSFRFPLPCSATVPCPHRDTYRHTQTVLRSHFYICTYTTESRKFTA